MPTVHLHEWSRANPESHAELADVVLPHDRGTSLVLDRLRDHRVLDVRELRSGLELVTHSWVGRFELGPLTVSVRPKIDRMQLMPLLRYAYRLRNIELLSSPAFGVAEYGFVDLLVLQLLREAEEILSRGMHRRYELREEWLDGLQGRIDFGRLAAAGGIRTGTLPCRYHPRTEDCLLNQALRAGLVLAAGLSRDPWLCGRAWRLSQAFGSVSSIRLGHDVFTALERSRTRLTEVYAPALRIARILWEGHSPVLDEDEQSGIQLEGFLFDMNRFFQALVGRFLTENLPLHQVSAEESLSPIFRYAAGENPCNRRAPRPRPDFVVRDRGTTVALLDTKYRDLWENPLPREMLYQLSVYALGHADLDTATILYPTTTTLATDQRLEIFDPVTRLPRGAVVLRPVLLHELAELVADETGADDAMQREAMAEEWVFGGEPGRR